MCAVHFSDCYFRLFDSGEVEGRGTEGGRGGKLLEYYVVIISTFLYIFLERGGQTSGNVFLWHPESGLTAWLLCIIGWMGVLGM